MRHQSGRRRYVQMYDSFTYTVLVCLEIWASARRAKAAVRESGALRVGGALPTNTDAGALRHASGMRGLFLICERLGSFG